MLRNDEDHIYCLWSQKLFGTTLCLLLFFFEERVKFYHLFIDFISNCR